MGVLVVDEGLRVLCRQNRTNLRGVTIIHCLGKLIPRHIFPTPSLLLKFIHLQLYGPSVHPTPHTNFQTRTGDMSWYQQDNHPSLSVIVLTHSRNVSPFSNDLV